MVRRWQREVTDQEVRWELKSMAGEVMFGVVLKTKGPKVDENVKRNVTKSSVNVERLG